MKQIIAIGGGGFGGSSGDKSLARYLLKQTKKSNPKVCFLPQASSEDQNYIVQFYETFTALNAEPSWISLFGRVKAGWQEKLLDQDLIYVGGGNTRSMIALWKEWGMDQVLREAYNRGIVLSGVSAGAICWFEQCITDSVWPLGTISGLNFLKGSCCPHYDSEPERRPSFLTKVEKGEALSGIALEDYVAAHYIDDKLHKVLSMAPNKKAYYIAKGQEDLIQGIENI